MEPTDRPAKANCGICAMGAKAYACSEVEASQVGGEVEDGVVITFKLGHLSGG